MSSVRPLARGDVILVRFPFTDLSARKVRPALIVGRVTHDDMILGFITSQMGSTDPEAEHVLEPTDPEFSMTGLKACSLLRLNKLATLHGERARRRLGRIGPQTERAVARALRYIFEL